MISRAYVDNDVCVEKERKRRMEMHQKKLSEIKNKDGVYKLNQV